MEQLSEELIDIIVSHVSGPLSRLGYADYLSLSLVSRQMRRITERHLYHHLIVWTQEFDSDTRRPFSDALSANPRVRVHLRTIDLVLLYFWDTDIPQWVSQFPNLREIGINMLHIPLPVIVPLLQIQNLTSLRLSTLQFLAMEYDEASEDEDALENDDVLENDDAPEDANTLEHDGVLEDDDESVPNFTNNSIKILSLSLIEPRDLWELCTDIRQLAQGLTGLQRLHIHSTLEGEEICNLNGPVFRNIVFAFRDAFLSSLHEFTFRYNDPNHGRYHYGNTAISNTYDARGIIQRSQLRRLITESNCLLRTDAGPLRSLTISPLCLPPTLRLLYLRHEVSTEMQRERDNLIYSEEAQCLERLVTILGKRSQRCPLLDNVTLAIFLPYWFEEIAARVVRRHARQAQAQIKIVFA